MLLTHSVQPVFTASGDHLDMSKERAAVDGSLAHTQGAKQSCARACHLQAAAGRPERSAKHAESSARRQTTPWTTQKEKRKPPTLQPALPHSRAVGTAPAPMNPRLWLWLSPVGPLTSARQLYCGGAYCAASERAKEAAAATVGSRLYDLLVGDARLWRGSRHTILRDALHRRRLQSAPHSSCVALACETDEQHGTCSQLQSLSQAVLCCKWRHGGSPIKFSSACAGAHSVA